jgi:predicted DsbA family dithiol-disulfide isomerase
MGKTDEVILEVFSDYACPWCYFSAGNVEKLKADHGTTVRWIVYPLHTEIPEEGTDLEELFRGHETELAATVERLGKVAAERGIPWVARSRTYNSRRAQVLGKWAESVNRGDEFRTAAFRAYFVDGKNIADISVLKELAGAIGLDGREAERALAEHAFEEAVDRDWEYCRACGVTSIPTFMAGGKKVVGAQPYRTIEDLVKTGRGNLITL